MANGTDLETLRQRIKSELDEAKIRVREHNPVFSVPRMRELLTECLPVLEAARAAVRSSESEQQRDEAVDRHVYELNHDREVWHKAHRAAQAELKILRKELEVARAAVRDTPPPPPQETYEGRSPDGDGQAPTVPTGRLTPQSEAGSEPADPHQPIAAAGDTGTGPQ